MEDQPGSTLTVRQVRAASARFVWQPGDVTITPPAEGKSFAERLHPRDRHGRFISIGERVESGHGASTVSSIGHDGRLHLADGHVISADKVTVVAGHNPAADILGTARGAPKRGRVDIHPKAAASETGHVEAVAAARAALPANREDIGKSPLTLDRNDQVRRARANVERLTAALNAHQAALDAQIATPQGGVMADLHERDLRMRVDDARDELSSVQSYLQRQEALAAEHYGDRLGTLEYDEDGAGFPGPVARAHLQTVLTAGTALDAEIERRVTPDIKAARKAKRTADAASKHVASLANDYDAARDELVANLPSDAAFGSALADSTDPRIVAYQAAADSSLDAWREVRRTSVALGMKRREAAIAVLAEHRKVGGVAPSLRQGDYTGDYEGWSDRLTSAATVYPDDWVSLSNDRGDLHAIDPMGSSLESRGFYRDRAANTPAGIALSDGSTVAVHELMHRMETSVPGISALEWTFQAHRTTEVDPETGRTSRPLKNSLMPMRGYPSGENGREDDYPMLYSGKEYRGTGDLPVHWEILTTTAESVFGDKEYADAEMRAFLLGVVATI